MNTRQTVQLKRSSAPKEFNQSDLEDIQAIESCKEGKAKAFAHIVHKYQPILLGKITSAVHDKEEARDIVQDIFIKVFANISKYQQSFTFNAWLTKFARNFLIDVIRKKKRSPFYNNTVFLDDPLRNGSGTQERYVEIRDESAFRYEESDEKQLQDNFEKINKLMGERLSSMDQNILKMYYLENLKQREISKLLNVNFNTVRAKIMRMRNKLHSISNKTIKVNA